MGPLSHIKQMIANQFLNISLKQNKKPTKEKSGFEVADGDSIEDFTTTAKNAGAKRYAGM